MHGRLRNAARGVVPSAPRLTVSSSSNGMPEGGSRSSTAARKSSANAATSATPTPRRCTATSRQRRCGWLPVRACPGRPTPPSLRAAPRAGSGSRGRAGGDGGEQEERRRGGTRRQAKREKGRGGSGGERKRGRGRAPGSRGGERRLGFGLREGVTAKVPRREVFVKMAALSNFRFYMSK